MPPASCTVLSGADFRVTVTLSWLEVVFIIIHPFSLTDYPEQDCGEPGGNHRKYGEPGMGGALDRRKRGTVTVDVESSVGRAY